MRMYSSSVESGQPVSSMKSESSCVRPSAGTFASSTLCSGDQYTGSKSLPVTSWRSASSPVMNSCRSPFWMRRASRSHAAPSRIAVSVTTWYDMPLPWA
jgi:hypothetical protein